MGRRPPAPDLTPQQAAHAVAVIGMSGRFPQADDVDEYWENLRAGRECFTSFTDEELLAEGVDPAELADPDYVRVRPVLRDVRSFDAPFFGMSPRDATLADPQQRLFTECAWEALESAGYGVAGERGEVGVFAGTNYSTYLFTRAGALGRLGADADSLMAGNDKDALATTVSYRLDLRGPSVAVQTFCSTSLVSVHLACAALRRGECTLAVAGGVSVRLPDRTGYLYRQGGQASPDGHVRAFDDEARGSVFGDGVAVVVLKRLDRAVADRDPVLAVVRGSAITNDGALKFSFQAPSIDGQRRCVEAALRDAGVDPADVSYVEAHGTATEVGDPIEVAALTAAYGDGPERGSVVLGSVKPNVGHLDRASGVTGLIKVVQALRHGLLPGTRNFVTPNRELDLGSGPFRVTSQPTPWPRTPGRPRIAAVSSLGMGGTNCHVVLSEAPAAQPDPDAAAPRRWQVLPVSARWEEGADLACRRLADRLAGTGVPVPVDEAAAGGPDLRDVAWTLQSGRQVFKHRRVVVADGTAGAVQALRDPAGPLRRADATLGRKVAFLFAGVGEQYPGLVARLYADEPGFRADVDACVALLGLGSAAQLGGLFAPAARPAGTADLARLLGRVPAGEGPAGEGAAGGDPAGGAHLTQPAVFVAEYALARLLGSWGVMPDLMIGYSVGEYVAACLAGVLDLADALRLVAFRARLIAALPPGGMLAVAADAVTCAEVLGPGMDELDVAVRTGSQLVLAGPAAPVRAAVVALLAAGVPARELATTHAYHSRMLDPAADELVAWIAANVTLREPRLPYVSNVTGRPATAADVLDPRYWARHMCGTVEFGAGLEHLFGDDAHAVVEIGPGASLGALVRAHPECPKDRWSLVVPTLPGAGDSRDASRTVAEAVARLWLAGVTVDWVGLHDGRRPGRVRLPTYPFQRREYWVAADARAAGAPPAAAPDGAGPGAPEGPGGDVASLRALPRLAEDRWLSVPVWSRSTPRAARPDRGHWLVLTDDEGPARRLADALGAALAGAPDATVTTVRPGEGFSTGPDGLRMRPGSTADATAVLRHLAAAGRGVDRVVHLWTLAGPGTPAPDAPPPATGAGPAAATGLRRGLYTLVALARAAGDLGLPPWTLDVVTTGVHRVHPGDPVHPERATLLGPCRLIPVEYPGCRARLVDADGPTLRVRAGAVVAELRGAPVPVVALRDGERWVPGFEELDPAAPQPSPGPARAGFRDGGTYLVTGGLGGIGLALAERIAADHRANLVLLGRTPVPAPDRWQAVLDAATTGAEVRRRLSALHRLRAAGHQVLTVAGDVTDPADVRRAVAQARTRFGALDGVLHCAGVPAMGLMQFKPDADIAAVLAPKVDGVRSLVAALRDHPPDFVVLFSSTTSQTGGGPGQVDYCAANAYLDACAGTDLLPGSHVLSVDWGEWTWNGWTAGLEKYDQGSRAFFEEYRATFGIDPAAGWRALRRALASGERQVVVSTQDFPTIVEISRRSSIAQHQEVVRRSRDAAGRHPRPDLSTPYVEPGSPTEAAITQLWADALGLEQVGVHDNFWELGGNSLVGMELIAAVRTGLAVPGLPPHLLYEAPTVASLATAVDAAGPGGGPPAPDDGDRGAPGDGDDRGLLRSRIDARRQSLRTRRTA